MEFLSAKWLWMYAGAALMLMEIMTPGFVVFFFGLAASAVGLTLFVVDLSGTAQAALFSALSILFLATLRRLVKSVFLGGSEKAADAADEFAGRLGTVVKEIRPGVPGRVLLGDAEWAAQAEERLEPGAEVRVTARRNLTLAVEKI